MRIINIDARTANIVIDEPNAGIQGEHRNTEIRISLPVCMTGGVDYWTVTFICDGSLYSTGPITDALSADGNCIYDDGVLKVILWQELTQHRRLDATVSAYKLVGTTPSLIASTPLISALYFAPSVNYDESPKVGGIVTAIANKVDKLEGKGLSSNDFTDGDKAKLEGVEAGAEVNAFDAITLNGDPVPVSNKTAEISAVQDDNYVHTDNNFTMAEKVKLGAIPSGAEANVINAITLNGNPVPISNKTAAIVTDKYIVQEYADLASLPQIEGTRATVLNDGYQLTFGAHDLEINDDLASPMIFPIPNLGNIGAIYDYPYGGTGNSVSVGFGTDAADGTPLVIMYVTLNGTTYLGISRDATIGNTALTKGWYNASDASPAEKPSLGNFDIYRFSMGGTRYENPDAPPADYIKLLSRFINISQNDMRGAGDYVYNGSAWEYSPKEDELLYFFGELLPNKKYFCYIGQDMSVTLPETVDATRDNSILLYLDCSADVDLSFPNGTRFYGGVMPDTTAGSHELTFICNPNTGLWTVGGLNSEAVT